MEKSVNHLSDLSRDSNVKNKENVLLDNAGQSVSIHSSAVCIFAACCCDL